MNSEITTLPGAPALSPAEDGEAYERTLSELKADFTFSVFYMTPRLRPHLTTIDDIAAVVGLTKERAEEYAAKLLKAGLWKQAGGRFVPERSHHEFGDLTLSEYMSMTLNLVSRMSESGRCWYESLFVPTNETLRREFYKKVNTAFKELIDESAKVDADILMAWSHSAVSDCFSTFERKEGH